MAKTNNKELKELGILNYQSVESFPRKDSKLKASYFKVKQGTNTAPRLNTRLVKMPEGLL